MSDIKQLDLVLNVETQREQQCAKNYQMAQKNVEDNRVKMQGLEDYRLNYLRMIQQKGQIGFGAGTMHQHHSFVGKLDRACEQQVQFLNQASLAAEQRKRQWMSQQQKRKAIEHLIAKKKQQASVIEQKVEQQLFDEIALQKYARRSQRSY